MAHVSGSIGEEVEVLRAIYGEDAVRISAKQSASDGICIEVDLQPLVEDGNALLVWVSLAVHLPDGYPSKAVPKLEVDRSRGVGDVAIDAMKDAATHAIEAYGLQEGGCLAPILSEVSDALGKSVSECSICMMDCDPGDAVFVACGCVFHLSCLDQWRGLKDREKSDKADAATQSIKSERDSLICQCEEATTHTEELQLQVSAAQTALDEAAKWAMTLQKRAAAAAAGIEEEEEVEEEESDCVSDEDEDGEEDEKWGTPQPSMAVDWGKGKKKNYKASTTRNKRRPRKYLNRIQDKIDEQKAASKDADSEEVAEAVRSWEKATFEVKEAKSILEKIQDDERKAQDKHAKLTADMAYMEHYLAEERGTFTSVPLLCPVCQNAVDDPGARGPAAESPEAEGKQREELEERERHERHERHEQEREEREERGAAEVAAVEDKLLFMMTKGAAGRLTKARAVTSHLDDDASAPQLGAANQGLSFEEKDDAVGGEQHVSSTAHHRRHPKFKAKQEQSDMLGERSAEDAGSSIVAGGTTKESATSKPGHGKRSTRDDSNCGAKTTEEELLAVVGQLMDAFSQNMVSRGDLLHAFAELMETLDERKATDRELRDVLVEMTSTLSEDVGRSTMRRQCGGRRSGKTGTEKKTSPAD